MQVTLSAYWIRFFGRDILTLRLGTRSMIGVGNMGRVKISIIMEFPTKAGILGLCPEVFTVSCGGEERVTIILLNSPLPFRLAFN